MLNIRAAFKFPILILMILSSIAILSLMGWLGINRNNARRRLYNVTLKWCTIKLTIEGTPAIAPALLVTNHCSYLDVVMLGASADLCFTPKDDVRSWPVIGKMVELFGVVFVNRSRTKIKESQQAIMSELHNKRRICVFPEATTNDGRSLKPFKPALFSIAELWNNQYGNSPLPIQPIAIIYESLDGNPLDNKAWDKIAWYGDMELLPHLWGVMKFKELRAKIIYLPPIESSNIGRKELSSTCEKLINDKLNTSH